MDIVEKSVGAPVSEIDSEHPNGEFEVVLSTECLDRDGERLYINEWKQPLPARIHIDGDHGRTLEKTVGSAVPTIVGDKLIGKGQFAGTAYAQMVRQLVKEGHISQVSVTYGESKNQKSGGPERELFNAAFVAIPANPEAVVLSSKSMTESSNIDDAVEKSGSSDGEAESEEPTVLCAKCSAPIETSNETVETKSQEDVVEPDLVSEAAFKSLLVSIELSETV